MSSSPVKFRVSDDEHPSPNVIVDADAVTTQSILQTRDNEDDDGDSEECMSLSECDACDERERFALLDSPPVTVLTGKTR